jgi:uncharacterized membrane protein YdjX (TVP38/TMEM64 family)
MLEALSLIAIVLIANAVPAFAPPTWMILVFFVLNYHLNHIIIIFLGVLSATAGRGILAWYFRKFAEKIPTTFSKNMDYAGEYLKRDTTKKYFLFVLFIFSPISSAQLFEAAGLMKTIKLRPLLAAFALGRSFSYSAYVTGASVVAATSFGELIIHELKSPWAIGLQIALILGLVAIGNIDWQAKLANRKSKN